MHDLRRLRRRQVGIGAGDRHEHDVDVAEPLEVCGRQLVAEVAEMADDEVVEPDGEDRVAASRGALVVVVKCRDTGHQDLFDLVLAGPSQHDRLPADRAQTGVPRVVVGDRHKGGVRLRDGMSGFRVGWVGEHDALAAAHAEAGVAEPCQIHGVPENTRNTPPGRRV